MHKRSINIQDPIKPIAMFPHLFPKEVASPQKDKVEASSSDEHISLDSLFKEEEKEAEVIPIY